ncbi:RluA family pseudouridine synthase [uncultured Pseudomonas sp.]|uniref:RluA family pseudouridine synthase n=1 Tax=uncultured Pseudomonas sp. TaxID=114707 RepID=UPI0027DE0009|nr:RluA family pseudouridine synthase [uncultured Pseudomonas sp.]
MPLSNIHIIHEDAGVLVINKPTLLLSVPGRADDNKDCLITRLQENGYPEARIVHRLDWETSGIILLARDADTHRELSRYDPPTKPRHVVDHEFGKNALTFWKILERCGDYCRVELTPITGRSHQLRVHMLSIGHPLLGDGLYAHPQALAAWPRLCLHASMLSFTHPQTGERLRFECPAPF